MIHLSISSSHLLCAQWSNNKDKPLLLSVSYKLLPRPLSVLGKVDNEIISVINAGLHLIREDISFEGEQVYVTVPDDFTHSALISSDQDMTENDAWEFARWTLEQRWSLDSKYEFFGRSFGVNEIDLYILSISSTFTEPIKMAIQELGGEPTWMGTESSSFFGLNPDKGCTIFYITKNGYNYYQYSQSIFQNGNARFIGGAWKLFPLNGSTDKKDVFKGQLYAAGKLSDKRKSHFKGNSIKQLVSMAEINYEGNHFPSGVKKEDLYAFSSISVGKLRGVALNFFDQPGLQPFNYIKEEVVKSKEIVKLKKYTKKIKRNKKKKLKKKNSIISRFLLYSFFFISIGTMLVYDQRPDVITYALSQLNSFKIKYLLSKDVETQIVDEVLLISPSTIIEKVDDPYFDFSIRSQTLISIALKSLALTDSHDVILLSLSDGNMDLELLGGKTMGTPIDSIGDVLNYSLRQIPGEDQFKHGYLVKYKSNLSEIKEGTLVNIDTLRTYVENIQNSRFKELKTIEKDIIKQTPIIIRLNEDNYIEKLLNYIEVKSKNLVLEKFVYKGSTLSTKPTAVFYLSLYSFSQPELED